MSAGAAAQRGRRAAERTMTDRFAAFSPNGTATVNGKEVPAFTAQGSTIGRIRVTQRVDSTSARFVEVGGVSVPEVVGGLRIPISATVPAVRWEYVMTAAGLDTDPALVGRRWRIEGVQADSYATARRLNVVEVPA